MVYAHVFSNLSKAAKLLNVQLIHARPALGYDPMDSVWVSLVGLSEPHYAPNGPVIVFQDHQLLHCEHCVSTLSIIHRPDSSPVSLFGEQPVTARSFLDFALSGEVAV